MPDYRAKAATPIWTVWLWSLSALAGAAAMGAIYGFDAPVVSEKHLRITLLVCAGLFALSRLLMLVPPSALLSRLKHWWVDYVLIIAAVAWWSRDHTREPVILQMTALYSIVIGLFAVGYAGFWAIVRTHHPHGLRPASFPLVMGALVLAIAGSLILSLPVCWDGRYPVIWDGPYPGYQLMQHWIASLFTATAALTCTGLSVREIGTEYSMVGQITVIVLMQIGGLVVLAIGSAVGWRLRAMLGWGGYDDEGTGRGLVCLIGWTLILAVVLEIVGAAVLFPMWDPEVGSHLDSVEQRILTSIFYSVSAFCNAGLTLTQDGLVPYRHCFAIYVSILPLMLLGSMGGPVLYEFCRRLVRRNGMGLDCLSFHSRVTILVTLVLIGLGSWSLQAMESTPQWQLRNPRLDAPGRLMVERLVPTQPAGSAGAWLSATTEVSERARLQRMQGMSASQKWMAGIFHAVSARTAGLRTMRMDENSLSPASRVVLMIYMLVGSDVGGTGGGLRLMVLFLLLGTLAFHPIRVEPVPGREPQPDRQYALGLAVGAAVTLFLLIAITTLILTYREAASPQACLFEAISACCNVGFSTGMTPQLSVLGRVALIVAMLLSRTIPLAILLRCRGYLFQSVQSGDSSSTR